MEKKSIITRARGAQDNYLAFWRRFEKRSLQFPRVPRLTAVKESGPSAQGPAPAGESGREPSHASTFGAVARTIACVSCAATVVLLTGCGSQKAKAKNQDFFTSGDRDADQRASQRMAQNEQLTGGGEGAGEKSVKKAEVVNTSASASGADGTNKAAQAEGKLALYDRLGGEDGLKKIVADFLPRAMQDPRVNWDRNNVTKGGFSFHHNESVAWSNSPNNVVMLQKHLVEFLALATGGPSHYEGKEMKSSHASMHISNSEFDATIGDLKVSLDRLQIPNKEQKELLAIVESTRPEIVTEH